MHADNPKNIARIKSKSFAIRIVKLYSYLCETKQEFVLSKQLLRSGTSIGANIVEASCGFSRKDFLQKHILHSKNVPKPSTSLNFYTRLNILQITNSTPYTMRL